MTLARRVSAFTSALLVVLLQLVLAGDGALACAGQHMASASERTASAMAAMPDMSDMPGMPSNQGGTPAPAHEGDCPDSRMPGHECQAMSACASIIALTPDVGLLVASTSVADIAAVAQLAPHSRTLPPESPPPRA